MEVDFEKAWFELKAHVASKRSHGADQLKVEMADIEVRCRMPEGESGFDTRPLGPAKQGKEQRPALASPA